MNARRTIGRAALAIAAAAAALALWASLASAALGGSTSAPDGRPHYVLTQTSPSDGSGTGGHHCHFNGGGPDDTTPSTATQNTSV